MKGVIALVVIFLAYVAADGNVLVLTPDNFDTVVDGSKGVFVEFYAPWCGHCKHLAPDYEVVGDAFAGAKEVVVAKVDADAHAELGARFDVHGFPTLKWFPKGSTTPEEYGGGRSIDDLVSFIQEKSGVRAKTKKASSSVVDLTPANFDKLVLDANKNVLIEFYAPWCGHCKRLAPDYEVVANAFANEPNVIVAKVDADAHKELAQRFEVTGFPTLKWFPKNNKEGEQYEGGRDVDAFVDFINKNAGTFRSKSGELTSEAGRVSSLDEIASKFLSGNHDALITEATAAASSLTGDAASDAKYYLKVMDSVKSTKDFVENEKARLDRMINGGSLSARKKDEFTKKKNVLDVFA